MSNKTITNIDNSSVALEREITQDETLTFAAADTFVKGTILARQDVAISVAASAVTGTGDGTVSAATVVDGPEVPIVGAWVLTVVEAITNGGRWELRDPNGALISNQLVMTAGAGVATIFEIAGLRFTITDGAADFAVDDTATLTVAADGKLVPFNPAGAGGAQIPVAVLTYEVTRTAGGDEPIQALVAGVVNRDLLVIDADGDGSNIGNKILDQLRNVGIVARDVQQQAVIDNPQS